MRKRFRGNQPISVSQELEGGGGKQVKGAGGGCGQLYGGRPAFEAVKETSGLDPDKQMDPEKTRGL